MPTFVIALLAQIASFAILYAVFNRRIRKQLSKGQLLEEIRDEVHGLLVELNQTTDRNVGLVEERITRLRSLLSDSDKKIQILSREIEKHQVGVDVYEKLKKSSRRMPSPEPALPQPTSQAQQPNGGEINNGPGNRRESPIQISGSDADVAQSHVPESDVRKESLSDRVMRLARQGFDSRIIAQKLDSTLGEVELILSLQSERDGRNG